MSSLQVSPLAQLLLQVAAILLTSRTLARVLRRFGQPLVIAEVVGGIALGPSLLGWLSPGAMQALFPASSLSALTALSQIGLVLFMFLVGLELELDSLEARSRTVVFISHAGVLVPFSLGFGTGLWLLPEYSPPGVPVLVSALFLGVAMSITAFPVLARILGELRLTKSKLGATAIASAAVDDATAWCLLSLVVAFARAQELKQALWMTGVTITFTLVMFLAVRPLLLRWGPWGTRPDEMPVSTCVVTLISVVICSSITEVLGIHALFGAFLFGAILPKRGKWRELMTDRLEMLTVVMFMPLFFAYSGLRTQMRLIDGSKELLIAAMLILVASLGKFGGSAIAARLMGLTWREAGAIGILMNTRGLMELVILNIGMDLGVISSTIFTIMVFMALVTTFATTPVLRSLSGQRWFVTGEDAVVPQAGHVRRIA